MDSGTNFSDLRHAQQVRSKLNSMEGLPFSDVLSSETIADGMAEHSADCRERVFTTDVVLWTFLSQVINKDQSCQAAVARTISFLLSHGKPLVLAAAGRDGQLLSTMRGEIIGDLALLERKLECPWTFSAAPTFPVLLLSRAATLSSHRREGFNLVLRYWFLRLAVTHGVRFVIGTFVAGSARERTLRAMGYDFFVNTLGWQQSTYRSLAPVTVAVLDMQRNGERALAYCLQHAGEGIARFSYEGGFPELKYVRDL